MAKIGEGDDRWIVADRADGTNVNNWHWTEKDVMEWTKARFAELLGSITLVEDPCMTVKTTGIASINGEACLNARKKKLIPNYELEIKVKWEGEVKDGSGASVGTATGKIHLPYIAEENRGEEPEVAVLLDKEDSVGGKLKSVILSMSKGLIIKAVHKWETELAAGEPGGVLKPEGGSASNSAAAAEKKTAVAPAASKETKQTKSLSSGGSQSVTITEKFYAQKQDLYEVFTDPRRIMAFSQSPAEVVPEVGGAFSMFGGSIQGRFTELVPGEKICQDWRFSNWEDGCYSKVEIVLEEPEPGNTILTLKQTGIPAEDKFGNHDVVGNCEAGWQKQMFHRIKAVFGYGV